MSVNRFTLVSVFTGAGGLDIGLEQVGFRTVSAADNDPDCVRTLLDNQAAKIRHGEGPAYLAGAIIIQAGIESLGPADLRPPAADANWVPRFAQNFHDLPYGDKVIHFTLFGFLALAANLALASQKPQSLARAVALGTILVLAIATAEEYSNVFVPSRDWSIGDLTANYLGVACIGLLPLWRPQLFTRPAAEETEENDSAGPHDASSC